MTRQIYRWPDFYIAGAPKAGTTALYNQLRRSDGIFLPQRKEPGYFCASIDRSLFFVPRFDNADKYVQLFLDARPDQKIGEATPLYLMDPQSPALIKEKSPHAKIIAMLRDPVERAFSGYLHHDRRVGRDNRPLTQKVAEALEGTEFSNYHMSYLLEPGYYARQLRRYWEYFGRENVLVIITEEYQRDEDTQLRRVAEFLDISPLERANLSFREANVYSQPRSSLASFFLSNEIVRRSASKMLPRRMLIDLAETLLLKPEKKPAMSSEERRKLEDIYIEEVLECEEALGRQLPWFHRNSGNRGS